MPTDELTIWGADVMRRVFGDAGRIALVGNGTVEEESTAKITAADVVVRFNNWASRKECIEQTLPHGSLRCDLLVTHFDLHSDNMGQGGVARPKLVVIGIPAPFQIDAIPAKLDRLHPDAVAAMVHPYWNRDLCRELGIESLGFKHPLPTLGLTAIYHLARMRLSAEFYVCGFDWHFDPATDSIQGVSLQAERLPGHFNHWYAREAAWISRGLYGSPQWQFSRRAAKTMERMAGKTFPWEATAPVTATQFGSGASIRFSETNPKASASASTSFSTGGPSPTKEEMSRPHPDDERYSELYRRGYGAGPVGSLLAWANSHGINWNGVSVLDCGCGHGALLTRVPEVIRYVGVDVSSYQIDVCARKFRNESRATFQHGVLDRIPFDNQSFDIAWCCDVMEHLTEADVQPALAEMARVAKRMVFSISTRASRILDANGGNLHLTVRPATWWLEQLRGHGAITSHAIAGDNVRAIVESNTAK